MTALSVDDEDETKSDDNDNDGDGPFACELPIADQQHRPPSAASTVDPVEALPFETSEDREILSFTKFPTYNVSEFFGATPLNRVGVPGAVSLSKKSFFCNLLLHHGHACICVDSAVFWTVRLMRTACLHGMMCRIAPNVHTFAP